MTTPISDKVAAAFATSNFPDWPSIVAFADAKIKQRYGWTGLESEARFAESLNRDMHDPAFTNINNPKYVEVQNYMDLSMGGRYLETAKCPFPSNPTLIIQGVPSLVKPLETATQLKAISTGFLTLRAEGLTPEKGKKAVTEIYNGITELRKLVPTTTSEILLGFFPLDKMSAPPDVRKKFNELISLTFSGTIPVKFEGGIAHNIN